MRRLILIVIGAYLLAMLITVVVPTSPVRAALVAITSLGALAYMMIQRARHE